LARGVLALALGVLVLASPDKSSSFLGNFMGFFWFMNGVMTLRWGFTGERARPLAAIVGGAGALAGIGMLLRGSLAETFPLGLAAFLLGAIIALTGVLHLFVGVRRGGEREPSRVAALMGCFELVLGIVLMITGADVGIGLYIAAGVWATLAGLFLIGDALRVRRLARVVATAGN
jgi:uncharacterized membrane protein HdeD (DUF308 family)